MQKMQRRVGAFLPRTADDHQVGMLIADFEAADKMLETLISASKTWEDSWKKILAHQQDIAFNYDLIYKEISGTNPQENDKYVATPRDKAERVDDLKIQFATLRENMAEEIEMIEKQIVVPAKEARVSVKNYMKVIKKREDKKLDWERYKSRMEKLEGKSGRSDRDNVALEKHRIDHTAAQTAYQEADDHLKQTLPNITHATYSLLPHLLNSQIMIQNAILGSYYTTLKEYADRGGYFNSDPPDETDDIIRLFEANFNSLRIELESGIMTIARGKAVKEPMGGSDKGKSYTGLGLRNGVKDRMGNGNKLGRSITAPPYSGTPSPPATTPGAEAPPTSLATRPKIQSSNSYRSASSNYLEPASAHGYTPKVVSADGLNYFGTHESVNGNGSRRPSFAPSVASSTGSLSSIASKKKPPPPPPPKRLPSYQAEYVTAIYDYSGDAGDLSFREGDRIKIVKKTDSKNDWWAGEVHGVKGQFPANYCQ